VSVGKPEDACGHLQGGGHTRRAREHHIETIVSVFLRKEEGVGAQKARTHENVVALGGLDAERPTSDPNVAGVCPPKGTGDREVRGASAGTGCAHENAGTGREAGSADRP